ncbi:MAG: DUF4837 family protein [Alistipes sp.]|jgi:hypothetical protein|nr:DUF4837 family protein [Alistipes sp.]
MAKFSKTIAAVLLVAGAAGIASCGGGKGGDGGFKPESQGAPYEIVVVADHAEWDGPVGDTLRAMFYAPVPMVNRQETVFDVLRTLPDGFRKLVTRHPNVLIVDIDEKYAEPAIKMAENVYAAPQMVISATAPDEASMAVLVDANRSDIMDLLENAERARDVADARDHTPEEVAELIRTKFGFEMGMGPGYTVRKEADDFLWISYETPTGSQGIIIYTYPFSGIKDFDLENLVTRRDRFAGLIPGENPGSHMSTNPDFTELVYRRINDRQWSEMRGFWDVAGDYMGGPYTNYSTLDVAGQRVVAIDFYVYQPNPRMSQRNYRKQLEHYLYTVAFPSAAKL